MRRRADSVVRQRPGSSHPTSRTTWTRAARRHKPAPRERVAVAATQDALYAELDLDLSWSEQELPERERTKHVHRLHPYLGKFIPQLVEELFRRHVPAVVACSIRSRGRGRRSSRPSRAGSTRRGSTSPPSTACSWTSRRGGTTSSASSTTCATRSR